MSQLCTSDKFSKGYALVTAMIFLVLLTLVALAAIRGSGLEAKMSSNSTERTQAFESSELARTLIENLIDANVTYAGWPASSGGKLPNDAFDASALALLGGSSCTSGVCITQESGQARNWYDHNSECTTPSTCPAFKPTSLDQDASYQNTITGNSSIPVNAVLSIYKLNVAPAKGAGLVMASGYEGLGHGPAKGGGNIFFYVSSSGHGPTSTDATAQTAVLFREVTK